MAANRLTSNSALDKIAHPVIHSPGVSAGTVAAAFATRSISRALLLLLIMATAAAPLKLAHAKEYLIEIIVFSQTGAIDAQELWNNDSTLKKEREKTLRSPKTQALEPEYFTPVLLSNAAAAIRRKAGFEVLSHIGWRQNGAPRGESPVIRLPRTTTSADLEGWMRIYLNTFIFAELDLTLNNDQVGFNTRPNSRTGAGATGTTTANAPFGNTPSNQVGNVFSNAPFRLKERRRVKFREIHYFDHPRLGVILTVQPAETSE